ncbi:unannotated protein [freshwater metagenome]|uniref:Unannotated protein n=1 Tax=freshwater metagenome TaxID=449393 RepID=A0A6J6EWW5_9ZZZZ
MAVVGRNQRCLNCARDFEQLWVGGLLLGNSVILNFNKEVVSTENILKSCSLFERAALVAIHERLQHLPTETTAGNDQSVVMFFKKLPVDLGLHVITLEKRPARKLDEVLVARGILGQRSEVVVRLSAAFRLATRIVHTTPAGGALGATVVGLIELGTNDRLHANVFGCLVEIKDAVHVAVIGNADRRLTIGRCRSHHFAHTRGSVEHRELGVQMQVGKGIGHRWGLRSAGVRMGPQLGELHRCDARRS